MLESTEGAHKQSVDSQVKKVGLLPHFSCLFLPPQSLHILGYPISPSKIFLILIFLRSFGFGAVVVLRERCRIQKIRTQMNLHYDILFEVCRYIDSSIAISKGWVHIYTFLRPKIPS